MMIKFLHPKTSKNNVKVWPNFVKNSGERHTDFAETVV